LQRRKVLKLRFQIRVNPRTVTIEIFGAALALAGQIGLV
jgi:hypothetical protein